MTDRETLEAEALETVSATYYYDLADSIDGMSDGELWSIIACDGDEAEEEKYHNKTIKGAI